MLCVLAFARRSPSASRVGTAHLRNHCVSCVSTVSFHIAVSFVGQESVLSPEECQEQSRSLAPPLTSGSRWHVKYCESLSSDEFVSVYVQKRAGGIAQ